MQDHTVFVEVARFAVAGVLGIAGLSKMVLAREFAQALKKWSIIPPPLRRPLSIVLPLAELTIAVGLVLSKEPRVAIAALASFVVFGAAIAAQLSNGAGQTPCGCSGGEDPLGSWMVIRNIAYALMAAAAVFPEQAFRWIACSVCCFALSLYAARASRHERELPEARPAMRAWAFWSLLSYALLSAGIGGARGPR
jgi:hypothetical protein